MARPLDLPVGPVVPQRPALAFPGPEHAPPAPEHPLLVARLGAALGREEVVPRAAPEEVRALGEAVRGPPGHGGRAEGAARREVDLADVDGEVF